MNEAKYAAIKIGKATTKQMAERAYENSIDHNANWENTPDGAVKLTFYSKKLGLHGGMWGKVPYKLVMTVRFGAEGKLIVEDVEHEGDGYCRAWLSPG